MIVGYFLSCFDVPHSSKVHVHFLTISTTTRPCKPHLLASLLRRTVMKAVKVRQMMQFMMAPIRQDWLWRDTSFNFFTVFTLSASLSSFWFTVVSKFCHFLVIAFLAEGKGAIIVNRVSSHTSLHTCILVDGYEFCVRIKVHLLMIWLLVNLNNHLRIGERNEWLIYVQRCQSNQLTSSFPLLFLLSCHRWKKSYKLNLKQRNIPHAGKVMHNSLTTSIGGHAEDFLMLHNGSWK